MALNDLLENLWQQYTNESPEALTIYNLFKNRGEQIVNDHIAFRTFDDDRVNVEQLGKIFEKFGYEARGEYHFEVKKLYAKHYEHITDSKQPKIFISELKLHEFSPFLQNTAKICIDQVPDKLLGNPELFYSGVLWPNLDYEIYQKLLSESEYAAWMYVFGFRANHFTVFANHLKSFSGIEEINQFLREHGFRLNTAGGEIKGTSEELLEQSSTMANKVAIQFKQGTFQVLNSYYEFARRYPQKDNQLYQGFIAKSADKIFESTNIGGM